MRRRVLALLAALSGACIDTAATAAEIRVDRGPAGGIDVITVTGRLERGDVAAFEAVADGSGRAAVLLDGPGGEVVAGMMLGEAIRRRGFATAVPPGAECASACALAWLGGVMLFVDEGALVGFHAAWNVIDGEVRETGTGNALVGAYLTRLGYPLRLVVEATWAPPDQLVYLTRDMAERVGLEVMWLPPEGGGAPAPSVAAADPLRAAEREAVAVVREFFAWLAEPEPMPPPVALTLYAAEVDYFGERLSREAVRRRQLAHARRWPVHRVVMEGEPLARCIEGGRRCRVTGRARFEARSARRNSRSDGTLRYALTLERIAGRFRIVAESSEVIDRDLRPIRPAAARLTRQIQAELLRLGCDPGPIDGLWGRRTAAALARFNRAYDVPGPVSPTARALARLKSVPGIICKR